MKLVEGPVELVIVGQEIGQSEVGPSEAGQVHWPKEKAGEIEPEH